MSHGGGGGQKIATYYLNGPFSYSHWSQSNFSSKYYNGESWEVTKFHFAHFLLLTTTFRRSSGWGWIGLEHFKWKKFQVYLKSCGNFRFLHIFTFAWCALLRSAVKRAYRVQWLMLSNRLMRSQLKIAFTKVNYIKNERLLLSFCYCLSLLDQPKL